jgi:hypothetical protein
LKSHDKRPGGVLSSANAPGQAVVVPFENENEKQGNRHISTPTRSFSTGAAKIAEQGQDGMLRNARHSNDSVDAVALD